MPLMQGRVSLMARLRYTGPRQSRFRARSKFMSTKPPADGRGKLKWFAVALLAVSAFMFVTIILKTMLRGP